MIKCFEKGSKTNYVDHNNKFVGFDTSQSCCERCGCGVYAYPIDTDHSVDEYKGDLSTYEFEGTKPLDCAETSDCGGGLAFTLISSDPTLPKLYVCIWNHHNGYYSHGFESYDGDGHL